MMTESSSWYVLRADYVAYLLRRAALGENVDLLMIELYANCDTEEVDDD